MTPFSRRGANMKRLFLLLFVLSLGLTTLVLAQGLVQATFTTASGPRQVSYVMAAGNPFFAADDMAAALGGKLLSEAGGYRFTVEGNESVLGTDSRFAILRDELIELPQAPIVIESRLFVPLAFFQSFIKATQGAELTWDAPSRSLKSAVAPREALAVQVSVVDLQDFSKVVLQFSGPTEYTIARDGGAYVVRLRNPLKIPFAEQSFEDPLVSRISFAESSIRIDLRSADIVGDAYRLENPFRIVFDCRKGVAPGSALPGIPGDLRPVDTPGVRTIVLDPGHGGREVGAIGPAGLMEKDVTLAICRKAADLISSRLGARVLLTRNSDELVPLEQRTTLANQYKADLFLSVHVNAAVVRGAAGTETYFLSLEASDELAKRAADRENEVQQAAPQTAKSSDLRLILWDLAQQDYLKESSRLAELLQEEMNRTIGSQNRGVKQAPFKVLVGATMPAALVEVGFISNPDDETRLRDGAFQAKLAEALADAVGRYKTEYESRMAPGARPSAAAGATAPASTTPVPPVATPATRTAPGQ